MPIVCPTVTAVNPHQYREQLERVSGFAKRIHLDTSDGIFTESKLSRAEQLYFDEGLIVDIHVMHQHPVEQLKTLIALKPNMIIFHAESAGDIKELMREVKAINIKTGVALLQNSQPSEYSSEIEEADHVLVFSGSLGTFGGTVDTSLYGKIAEVKKINPDAEIGWDGGVNDKNAKELVDNGVDVLNVGGFIQKSDNPQSAYDIIMAKIQQ